MNSPKSSAPRALNRRLRDSLTLLVVMFIIAFSFLAWQGTISLKGVRGAFTPPLPRMQAFKSEANDPYVDDTPPAAALQAPKQQTGASRWTEAFTGLMPPFKSWMPPKVIAQAAAWGDSVLGREAPASKEELSTLKYSFPDALPKVALLFLTRMGIPYEAVWKAFLESVPNFGGQEGDSWMLLFNVYVHTPPNVWLHDSSFFRHYQLWDRVQVEWGQWSVVEAEKLLMRQALADPLNQRFVLLSETCVPLYPAPLVWAQLQGETRSRVNACANSSNPDDENWRMTYRWNDAMESPTLKKEHWRKSGQWFVLNRRHVQIVVNDTEVAQAFKEHCWVDSEAIANGWGPKAFCPADEHYIPTLLASKGLDNETDCTGSATSVWWDGPYFHPKEFQTGELSIELIDQLRGHDSAAAQTCDAPGALESSAILLPAVRRTLMEMDVVQEAPGLSRRQRQATGEPGRWSKPGRSLKDVWHGLSTQSDVPQVDSVEAALAKEASFDREVGRVLLQWGQSSEGLQEMLLQTIEDKERVPTPPPGILPSWAVPAIEGVPEAVQAASKAVTKAAKDAKESLQSVVAAGASVDTDKDRDQGEISERMAEFLTLAEAVRGLKGKGNTVSHVGSPKPAPAEAPAAAALAEDRRNYWTNDQGNSLLEAMIADYSPLGSASCALFARKFREEDVLTFLSVAEGYLQRPPALEPLRKANRL